jgi:hypothetical protein
MTADDDRCRLDRPSAGERMCDHRSAASSAKGQEHHTRALLARLGRPHASGGTVIERAALLAEGADFDVAMAWILAHGGMPEAHTASSPVRGLYGARSDGGAAGGAHRPRRFVLPPGALDA